MAGSGFSPIYGYLEGDHGAQVVRRFWNLVDRRGDDECWDWKGSTNKKGYGRFKVAIHEIRHGNRVAWAIDNGRDPGDLLIRHTCDRPSCCNPAHLISGTHQDNMDDMRERGRASKDPRNGVLNNAASLTLAQIGEIVAAFRRHEPNTTIALRYPVGHSLISRIRTGRSWQREAAMFGWAPSHPSPTPSLVREAGR
ncbi:MAG: hypothetical protein JWR85_3610 [Marmoricola sp.]|nr:hypothetical protein [Marmoricola sp.]